MSTDVVYMSESKFNELKERLEFLKKSKKKELAQKIEEAREKGDLSENADYHAAKEALAQTEMEIYELENLLSKAKIIPQKPTCSDKVYLYSNVEVINIANNTKYKWQIVGDKEGNLSEGKIPVSSPVGKSLIGKTVGEIVEVQTPRGLIKYKIISIQ